ncbi:MAG: hypothetical protein IPH93_03805 [Saprospiraceae bacterium]|nr:hypothetical protein [Saprospiraceae bacterium]MBK9631899.1 hypothetical protein [Saprospiraceae bacterium]
MNLNSIHKTFIFKYLSLMIASVKPILLLPLISFFACVHTPVDQDCLRLDCFPNIKGDWNLSKVEMYHFALGPLYKEDVSYLMVGNNPSVLSFDKKDFILAPGSSLHYIPITGKFEFIKSNQSNIIRLTDQSGTFTELPYQVLDENTNTPVLVYENTRTQSACSMTKPSNGNRFIYYYQKVK